MTPHAFAFVMDQQVGLRTQALNIERVVTHDPTIQPTWVPVRYDTASGPFLSRFPGLPSQFRGTLAGTHEIREGLKRRRFDGALWATWAAKSVPDLVAAAPAYLVMDMTPIQMEQMGEHYGYSRLRARFLGGLKRQATEKLYRQATHLFPWNEWVARSLRDDYGVPAHKITPISPGVDLARFYPTPTEKPQDGVVRLLFVGGDFNRKGGDLLLEWARQTKVKTPWELHIVTRDTVTDLPAGVFVHHGITNNSPELARFYQQSDLFVLPTRADCYSLVAMEAMACGLPVLITNLGGIPEIINDGKTGMLIEPDDFAALSDRLDRMVDDAPLRQRMSAAAYIEAIQRFDAEHNVGCILNRMRQEAVA